jgi:hypothetical protein
MASRKNNQLNIGLGVDLENLKKGFADAIKTTKGSTDAIEKEAKEMAASLVASMKKIESATTLKQASRQLDNMVAKMHAFGMEGTAAFNQVVAKAGDVKAQLDDVKGLIDAARPDAPFNALSTTLGAAAQGFAGLQGAMALFGNESEEVQKTLLKVQAAMALAEGFKAIDGLTDGFAQLNMVIKANPIAAVATALAAVTAAYFAFADSTDEVARKQRLLNDISDSALDSYAKEKTELDFLLDRYNDKNTTDQERIKIQKELVDKFPEYFSTLSTERVEIEKTNRLTSNYIDLLVKKAKAQAAFDMYVEKLKEVAKAEKEVGTTSDKLMTAIWRDPFSKGNGLTNAQLNVINLKKELQGLEDTYKDLAGAAQETNDKIFVPKSTVSKSAVKGSSSSKSFTAQDVSGLSAMGLDKVPAQAQEASKAILGIAYSIEQTNKKTVEFNQRAQQMGVALNALVQGVMFDFGTAIGNLLSGSDTAMQDFGKAALMSIAGFMETLAKAQIATAIASEAFQKLLFTNPAAALAAGIALAAGAAIVKNMLQKGPKGEGFASGGLIPGASFSGDRLLAPVNSGEVVLNTGQQNELLRLANGGGMDGVKVVQKFTGKDLITMLEYANQDYNR